MNDEILANPHTRDIAPSEDPRVGTGQYTLEPDFSAPANLIGEYCERITPQMLTLVTLTQEQVDAAVATVPGGASNVQDIYPLTPLQEGMLFHHLLDECGDTHILSTLFELASRAHLDALIDGLQKAVDRHDALRTAIFWEGLPRPVQVVCRKAALVSEEVALPSCDDPIERLKTLMPRGLDLRQAPLMRLWIAADPDGRRWYAVLQRHHVVFDHQSWNIVFAEAMARSGLHEHDLASPLAYRNYIAWSLRGATLRDAETFFTGKLQGFQEPTAPFGLIDAASSAAESHEAGGALELELARRIRERSRVLGVSAARLFHAAYALVVGATSGANDVVFGTIALGAHRRHPQVRGMVGLFVNTLPLRLRLDDVTAEELVTRTHRELKELLNHQQASPALIRQCWPNTGGAPLFAAVLNYRQSAGHSVVDPHAAPSGVRMRVQRYRTNYPVMLVVDDLGDEFALTVQTDRRIDPHRIAAYMQTALHSLVQALEHAPHTRADALAILPDDERRQLFEVFNATQAAAGLQDKQIHELFEEQVARTPDAIAVAHDSGSLTYTELNCQANRLARYLQKQGVGPNQLVAICVERGAQMAIGLLGILKAGAAYVPLDPNYPPERLQYMLNDAGPRVVLTQRTLCDAVPSSQATLVAVDELLQRIDDETGSNLLGVESQSTPDSLVYVIYTSGTTGRPKGIAMPHRSMVNLIEWHRCHLPLEVGQRVLQFAALSFDVAFQEIFSTLCLGGTLVFLDEWVRRDARALTEFLNNHSIERLFVPPLMLQSLAEYHCRAKVVPQTVRDVIVAGEQLRISPEIRQLFEAEPGCRLHNHYGPTETHVVTALTLTGHAADWAALPTIGRPIANTRIYILDSQYRPVPLGAVGEIYIAGANVARGYLNRPELTAERFIHDPFGLRARMYKTGDLGRWRPDGTIEYLGRNDDQVKVRGFRVELGEIESRLAMHPLVREAAVVAREDVPGQKRLAAYITLADTTAPSIEDLRSHLQAGLPEYMIPAAFVILDRLPLTPSGKLDRRALPMPQLAAYASKSYEAPQREIESIIAGIWQELLRVERVGRQDNFFELGGHSLLLVQMMERLRRVGLTVKIRSIYESRTLAELASTLTRGVGAEVEIPPNRIPAGSATITPEMLPLVQLEAVQIEWIAQQVPGGIRNVQDIYPLAPLQDGILFHHLYDDRAGDTYLVSMLFALASRARLDDFIAGLQLIVDRHEILRTAVLWEQLSQPVQVIHRRATVPVEEFALSSDRDPVEQLKETMRPDRQRLDIRRAPLVRLQTAADPRTDKWYAILQLHHLACDHESLDSMLMELVACLEGRAADLPEAMPYRNHVAQALALARTADTEAFFRGKLGEVTEPTTPFGLVNVHDDAARVDRIEQPLEPALAQRVRQHARRLGVSAATLFHVAWGLVVARTSGRDDVVFGTVLLGRLQGSAGAHRVLGLFMNTLPCRLRMCDVSVEELVEHTQREIVDLLCHEQASLSVAQRCSGIASSLPLFSTLLNYRWSTVDLQSAFARVGMARLGVESHTNYPVAVSVLDQGSGFLLDVQTRHLQASRMLGYVTTALQSLVEALDRETPQSAASLSILPEDERRLLIDEFNATQATFSPEKLIHELFEERAARTPEAVAIVEAGRSLTYAQVNAKANQLARYLLAAGVATGDCVPVLMSRSCRLLIVQLALLKTGAVYLPIDPDLPRERQIFMIRDCAATHVIANRARDCDLEVRWIHDEALACADTESSSNLELRLPRGLAAYVMYTSGSTGVPKGVIVPHHAVNRLAINNGYARILPDDCIAHHSNPAFDASTFEVWGALLNGARTLIVPQSVVLEPAAFVELLRNQHVTILWISVGLFNQYVDVLGRVSAQLRYLITGGDALEPKSIRRVLRRSPPQHLLNAYGPTECTTFSTTYPIESVPEHATTIPIGRPIANTQIYILDAHRRPVAIGVPGEIHIGGAGVALGYLNRPELTAERFVRNPFDADPHARLYKTGDLGCWRADGMIEFLGRNDHQVKLRGFRIELGEIEAHLARHERVSDAVVLAREDATGERRLVGYVVMRGGPDAAELAEALRTHLRGSLPEYMVPSALVVLDRFPLTANGKVDRRALPAPEARNCVNEQYEAPQGEIESQLARIWEALLAMHGIGRHDDFFALGGHSLLVLQLLFKVNQRFGCGLRVTDVYRNPRLRELAAHIRGDELHDERVDLAREAVLSDAIAPIPGVPCSPAQAIFVTGSTGFVGRFLLAQLLRDTHATVYCLVRAPSQWQAARRLRLTLARWDLWNDDFESRLVAVPGDLRLARLGIEEATYEVICRTVDSIYHCGTSMNHLETYDMAKPANVDSAREVLQIATSCRPKLVNYISTLAVFAPSGRDTARIVDETTPIDAESHLVASGYAASKWVGEKIFMLAAQRRVPCNIFRLGLVWADSQQGRYDELQREYRLLKSCLLSGCGIANYRHRMPPTPVDYVARAIVFLADRYPNGEGVFHISSMQAMDEGVFERCRELIQTPLALLPYYEWICEMKERHDQGQSLPVIPLIDFAFSMSETSFYEHERRRRAGRVRFECARTHRELERAGIVAPVLNDVLLSNCLSSMLSRDAELRDLLEGDCPSALAGQSEWSPRVQRSAGTAQGRSP